MLHESEAKLSRCFTKVAKPNRRSVVRRIGHHHDSTEPRDHFLEDLEPLPLKKALVNRHARYIAAGFCPALYDAIPYRVTTHAKHDRYIAGFGAHSTCHRGRTHPDHTRLCPNEFF